MGVPQVRSRALERATGFALATVLAVTALIAFPAPAAYADEYPGQDEINAAHAAANDAAASVSQLDTAIAQLEDALHQADVAARVADEDYQIAQEDAVAAQRHLYAANKSADEADAALQDAKSGLAAVAMASYRNAGSMGNVEAIVKADGFDDVVKRTEGIARASASADSTVQKVHAAEIVATTTRTYAEEAAVLAEAAEATAETALETAQTARVSAEQAVTDAASAHSAAVARLAEMRGVTAELEQERQDGLAAERAAREIAEFEERQQQLEASDTNQSGNNNGAGNNPGSGSGGGTSTPAPTNPSQPAPSNPTPQPEQTPDPAPEQPAPTDPDPQPEPEPEPEPAPDPEPAPKPDPTPDPKPTPPASWRSSASQGSTAADHSLTMRGASYQLGGNGPAYDCSGLTVASWRKAGISIPRSSRAQYGGVTHLAYSELRKGDLVFWGTSNAQSSVYHVAIYIGNGQVMEARTYGVPAQTRNLYAWGVGNLMPYIGRP